MNKSNNILITGITGQDGIFLTSLFLKIQVKHIWTIKKSKL